MEEQLVLVSCRQLYLQKAIRVIGSGLIHVHTCPMFTYGRKFMYANLKIFHVSQPPIHKTVCTIHLYSWVYGVEILSCSNSVEHFTTKSDIGRMQHPGLTGACSISGTVVNNYHYLKQFLISTARHELGYLMFSI